jgi:hypothetical protein
MEQAGGGPPAQLCHQCANVGSPTASGAGSGAPDGSSTQAVTAPTANTAAAQVTAVV